MNKRNLKKSISNVCNDIIEECFFAEIFNGDDAPVNTTAAIVKAGNLEFEARRKVSVSFDRQPKDFPNRKEYNKARRTYYKKAYAALHSFFNQNLEEIVKDMNAAVKK